mmetsp:Transcript_41601/g.134446  ORF Transcript_41601/g.134446 Transcript_41601/m.134446 type:complete len:587 (-) Transcript_41601:3609-5369(-)
MPVGRVHVEVHEVLWRRRLVPFLLRGVHHGLHGPRHARPLAPHLVPDRGHPGDVVGPRLRDGHVPGRAYLRVVPARNRLGHGRPPVLVPAVAAQDAPRSALRLRPVPHRRAHGAVLERHGTRRGLHPLAGDFQSELQHRAQHLDGPLLDRVQPHERVGLEVHEWTVRDDSGLAQQPLLPCDSGGARRGHLRARELRQPRRGNRRTAPVRGELHVQDLRREPEPLGRGACRRQSGQHHRQPAGQYPGELSLRRARTLCLVRGRRHGGRQQRQLRLRGVGQVRPELHQQAGGLRLDLRQHLPGGDEAVLGGRRLPLSAGWFRHRPLYGDDLFGGQGLPGLRPDAQSRRRPPEFHKNEPPWRLVSDRDSRRADGKPDEPRPCGALAAPSTGNVDAFRDGRLQHHDPVRGFHRRGRHVNRHGRRRPARCLGLVDATEDHYGLLQHVRSGDIGTDGDASEVLELQLELQPAHHPHAQGHQLLPARSDHAQERHDHEVCALLRPVVIHRLRHGQRGLSVSAAGSSDHRQELRAERQLHSRAHHSHADDGPRRATRGRPRAREALREGVAAVHGELQPRRPAEVDVDAQGYIL